MIHIREPYQAAPHVPELPPSVVWLQRGTLVCVVLVGLLLLAFGLSALARSSWFAIERLAVRGDTQFHNALTLRANVLPQLSGNYFTLNLRAAQAQFEALPWIRTAIVQRVFPNQLQVHLTAHEPAARWLTVEAETGSERVVNRQGEIFEAAGGVIDLDVLPALQGPDSRAKEMLTLLQSLQQLKPEMVWSELLLSPLGIWQVRAATGAEVTLGSGTGEQVLARASAWLASWPELAKTYGASVDGTGLLSVDLRYPRGYAVRTASVSTRSRAITKDK